MGASHIVPRSELLELAKLLAQMNYGGLRSAVCGLRSAV